MRTAAHPLRAVILLCALSLWEPASAQRAPQREVFGSVTGHVSCADTNQPARLTSITLQAVPDPAPRGGSGTAARTEPHASTSLTMYQTRLDGSFQIRHVKPGRYYVVVQKPGYLSPAVQFTREEISHPDDEMRALIATMIPTVSVNANESANVEVRLMRAATINGTIRYDDGSAAPELSISIKKRGKDGRWPRTQTGRFTQTDDGGHYRLTGLPAGEYRLHTQLAIEDREADTVFGGSESFASHTKYELPFYLGDTFREREAKVLKLNEGEESSGADFTIPVAKLHTVTGSLVDARSGRVINAGTIKLFTADGDSEMASAKIEVDEPTFRFDFVPEGEYIVRVEDPREVTRELIVFPPGAVGYAEPKETIVHNYGRYEAPFRVQTDMTGVTLPMPERDAKNQQAATTP